MRDRRVDTGTWGRARAVAAWSYQPRHGGDLAADLARVVDAVVAAARGFAAVRHAVFASLADGASPAFVEDRAIDGALVAEQLARDPDLDDVRLGLDLLITTRGAGAGVVENGAEVRVRRTWPAPDAPRLRVSVILHVDLYAAHAPYGADSHDNRALAVLNAPRLTGFLTRLVEGAGLELIGLDDTRLGAQMQAHGFVLPAIAFADDSYS